MNVHRHMDERLPSVFIEDLIARHGAWPILREVASALMRRRKPTVIAANDLSDRIRRDIGLEPVARSPRHWDLRL